MWKMVGWGGGGGRAPGLFAVPTFSKEAHQGREFESATEQLARSKTHRTELTTVFVGFLEAPPRKGPTCRQHRGKRKAIALSQLAEAKLWTTVCRLKCQNASASFAWHTYICTNCYNSPPELRKPLPLAASPRAISARELAIAAG